METMLNTLYRYHSWANADLLEKLEEVAPDVHADALKNALRLVGHLHVVSKIFAGHLQAIPHGFTSDHLGHIPPLSELHAQVSATDAWYREFVSGASQSALSEQVSFTFTDGDQGCMSRQEMLLHVALHAAIHRGEVSRILWQVSITPPWDTLAVFLHQAEPDRRQRLSAVRV